MIDDFNIDTIGNEEEVQVPIEDIEIIEDSKTIIEEPEPTKDDILIKSSNVKAGSTEFYNDSLSADYGIFNTYKSSYSRQYKVKLSNIPIGTEYQMRDSTGTYPSDSTYYVRGLEIKVSNNRQNGFIDFNPPTSGSYNHDLYVIIKNDADIDSLVGILNDIQYDLDNINHNIFVTNSGIDSVNQDVRYLHEFMESIPYDPVFISVFGKSDNNNQNGGVGMVSQNIMTTPINQYGLSDSMNLILILMAVAGILVYIIHKSIFKWGKK